MLQRIKSIGIKKIIRWLALFLLSARMFLHLFYSPEKEFQIYKDMELYYAIIIFMVILTIYRKISLIDWKNWAYAALAIVAGVVYFEVKDYRIATLDVECFKWTVLRAIMQFMFLGLMLDLIRHKPYSRLLSIVKSPMVIIYILTALIFLIFDDSSVYPVICPIVVLIFTEFSDEYKEEFAIILSLGIYAAFAKVFTGSLIAVPLSGSGERYSGYFLNSATASDSCTAALIACLFLLLFFKEKGQKKLMTVSLVAALYPLASVFIFQIRGIYLALLFVIAGIIIFMHGKGQRETYKRLGITVIVAAVGAGFLFGASYCVNHLIAIGKVEEEGLRYFWSHLAKLTNGEGLHDYFAKGSILFGLDNLASGRFEIWARFIKQIRFAGQPIEIVECVDGYVTTMAHNFFIQNLVRCGILGGSMYILWYISYIVRAAKMLRVSKKNPCAIYALLWAMYMLGIYLTQAEFFNCTGGFMLLVSMCFVTENPYICSKEAIIDSEKEKLSNE